MSKNKLRKIITTALILGMTSGCAVNINIDDYVPQGFISEADSVSKTFDTMRFDAYELRVASMIKQTCKPIKFLGHTIKVFSKLKEEIIGSEEEKDGLIAKYSSNDTMFHYDRVLIKKYDSDKQTLDEFLKAQNENYQVKVINDNEFGFYRTKEDTEGDSFNNESYKVHYTVDHYVIQDGDNFIEISYRYYDNNMIISELDKTLDIKAIELSICSFV